MMGEAGLPFRRHPDVGPSGKVTILGPARCDAERMTAYAARRNPNAPDLAQAYLKFGAQYGVRGDVAYWEALYDTRAWTMEQASLPWKSLTLNGGGPARDESGVEHHIQLLYAFAAGKYTCAGDAAEAEERRSRMERAGWLGTVRHWEDLNGKWQLPGSRYGQDIVAIWRGMMEWSGKGEVHVDIETPEAGEGHLRGGQDGQRYAAGESAESSEDMIWLRAEGLLAASVPHPNHPVTWAELASVLRRWSGK